MTSTLWRNLFIAIGVTLICLYGVIGMPTSMEAIKAHMAERIKLGLDLKGGTHLVLQVQVQDAARAEADQAIARLQADLRARNVPFTTMTRNNPETIDETDNIAITITGVPTDRAGELKNAVDTLLTGWTYNSTSSDTWVLKMTPSALAQLKSDTLTQSMATIENRINGLGLTEPVIQQHGRADSEHEILVQLPGVSDPARVMELLQMSAQLEIQEVLDGPYPSRQAAIAAHNGMLPPNSEVLSYGQRGPDGAMAESWYLLNRTPIVTGRDLRSARPARDTQTQQWQAAFQLSREAGARFGTFTGSNVGKPLAVVLDNRVKNVATIQSRIDDEGVIQGLSGEQEASDLALVLRAGSLPASVEYLEERTVGASLGADSIQQGINSSLYGLAIIVVVMLLYYKGAGLNAVVALVLNLIILVACLSYFGFTLTLPGIAGIILTIGMAVDANVLVFERIREELRAGKGVVGALNAGFGKAILTIIDTNLTTIIAAAFLFLFGSGPVRGFAVTLAIGLIANLFTSVFVSRLIFDLMLAGKKQVKTLSI
ncbi:MAG: protein translocase subunit SecD [Bryobacterales bacterium]|nr:protein translocase subunit SecD [Bryobacterales bacterium]